MVTGRGFAAPPVVGFGLGPDSWETSDKVYRGRQPGLFENTAFGQQPRDRGFGGQRDFSGVYETERPSYGRGGQSDDYWSQNDPYYGSSEIYRQESDPYGVGGRPYATSQINDYDRGLSGVSPYSDQSEVSWGDLQAPWQATPPYRTSGSSRALETPFRTKGLSVMQPYHGNINALPGPLLKSDRVTSYQTDFTAPAHGEQAEVLRRLNQLYRFGR